jgi:hypothetical protein
MSRSWYEDRTFPLHLRTRKRMHNERYRPTVDPEREVQQLEGVHPSEEIKVETKTTDPPSIPDQRTNYNLRAKSFAEQQAVLSLRRLSQIKESESNISGDGIEELTNALITDAPPEVAQAVQRDELAALTNLQSLIQKRLSIVLQAGSAPALNGTGASEAPTDVDDLMDGIS